MTRTCSRRHLLAEYFSNFVPELPPNTRTVLNPLMPVLDRGDADDTAGDCGIDYNILLSDGGIAVMMMGLVAMVTLSERETLPNIAG